MTSATAASARATATLRAGIFRIKQRRAKGRAERPTDLVLTSAGGAPRRRARRRRARARCARCRSSGGGLGGASTTTATKASFTTQDRCNGTLTKVAKGKVVVHEPVRTATARSAPGIATSPRRACSGRKAEEEAVAPSGGPAARAELPRYRRGQHR